MDFDYQGVTEIRKSISIVSSFIVLLATQTLSLDALAQHYGNIGQTTVPVMHNAITHVPTTIMHNHNFSTQNNSAGQSATSGMSNSVHHSFFHHHQLDSNNQASQHGTNSQGVAQQSGSYPHHTYGTFINALNSGNLSSNLHHDPGSTSFSTNHILWGSDHSTHIWSNTVISGTNHSSSINLDLSSSSQNMTAGHLLHNGTITIDIGGKSLSINSKTELTAAEYLAVMQVASGGQQAITLNSSGIATGGTVVINQHLSQQLSSLVIPQGVTVVDLSKSGTVNLSGNIIDNGKLYLSSFNSSLNTINLNASNITVQSQGLISDVLPANTISFLRSIDANLNLTLNAVNSITNFGTIASANSLNLTSGSGSITNSGNITATTGNVNFNAPVNQTLVINNTGGTIQAGQNINVRDAAYTGSANMTLTSGNWLSQQLNLNSGTGTANANIENVSGAVNTTAGAEHFSADTNNLILSNINVSGDPSYFNTGGAVTIASDLVFSGQDLAIVANTNIITAAGAGIINTGSSTSNGGNITMIAGAAFTSYGAAKGNDNTATTLTVTGGTSAGGYIDLNGNISGSGAAITSLTSSSSAVNGNGGNINLIAYGGTANSAGQISLPTTVPIASGGNGSGSNGSVTVISGANSGNGITIGAINATGGRSGGNISLLTGAPTIISGSGTMTIKNGSITNGASFTVVNTSASSITAGNLTSPGAIITVIAGTSVTTGAITSNGASANGAGGIISLAAGQDAVGSLQVNGDLNAIGSGNGKGGIIDISYNGSSAFLIGASNASNNYVSGNISANSGVSGTKGGTISIGSFAPLTSAETPLNVVLTGTLSAVTSGSSLGNVNFIGQTINVGGTGALNAVVNNNSDAGAVSYTVGTGNLTLGQISNASGNITATNNNISGAIFVTQNITSAGVSLTTGSGGIAITGSAGISTNSSSGNAGNISLIAKNGAISIGTGNITAEATGATGNGGTIAIQGLSFSANDTINASANNDGNGGTITIATVGPTANLTASSAFELLAQGGITSGNGGTVSLSAGQNLLVTSAAVINVNARATNSNGGTINLTNGTSTAGTLEIDQSLTANGSGSGNGGQITISVNSNSVFLISGASGNGVNGTLAANGGNGTGGSGGSVSVTNRGSGGITLLKFTDILVASSPGSGAGGNITLNAGNGLLTIPAGTMSVNAAGPGSYHGGSISLTGSNIVFSGGTGVTLSLLANGSGSGNGGSISVRTTSATGDITLGNAAGDIALISATGGSIGSNAGNGGSVTLNAGRNLFIPNTPNIITVSPLGNNGNGGSISLTNGSVTVGTLYIDQSLNANGSGNGSGGQITISNNSNSVFLISGVSSNGINGVLTATGGNGVGGSGGSVSVTNRAGGGITLVSYSDILVTPSLGGGAGGNIILNANNGLLTLPAGTMNVSAVGPGSYNGGSISLTGSNIVLNGGTGITLALLANGFGSGNGGSISVHTTSATGDITLGNAPGNIASISATGGSIGSNAGNGGSVTLNAGRNLIIPSTPNIITVNPLGNNGNGGSIYLTAGSASGSTNVLLQVNQSLSANGAGTGNGGIISVSYHDAINPLVVGGIGSASYINGPILANAGNSGANGGTITITNTAAGPLTVSLLSEGTVSAGGANLGHINFNPASGQAITVAGSVLGYGNLVGIVNATGTSVYINPQAANTTLTTGTIGSTSSSGFVMLGVNNGNSTINLDGGITTSGGPLSIISSGNIGSVNGAHTTTAGGAITIIAGAAFTPTQSTHTFSVTGNSLYGGSLNLSSFSSFSTAANSGNTNGGNITIAALFGTNSNAGMISGPFTTIYSGGSGSGTNGNVTIISEALFSIPGIAMAGTSIDTVGGTGGGGNVTVAVTIPIINNAPLIIQNGAITSGSFSPGLNQSAQLSIGNILTSTGNVLVTGGGSVSAGTITTTTGNVFAYNSGSLAYQSLNVGNVSTGGGYVTLASNSVGTVLLPSSITTDGGNVNLISGGSIQFSGPTSSINTSGGGLTVISGAGFFVNGTTAYVFGANNTNGSINFSSGGTSLSTATSNINGNGGAITIAAFAGASGLASINSQNNQLNINANGNGTGANGNVLVLAGGSNSTYSSYIGNINTSNGASGGNVTIATASPAINGGELIINNGAITSGSLSPGDAQNSDLNLNNITAAGNIALSSAGNISAGAVQGSNVAVVSGGNIVFNSGSNITTNGGDISLLAGAAFNNNDSAINIIGGSNTGGSITFANGEALSSVNSTTGGTGGNILMVAYNGSDVNSGAIVGQAASPVTINTGGNGNGINGNVTVLAGGFEQKTIDNIGSINTTGATGGGGNISLITAVPVVSSGGVTITDSTISSGNFSAGTIAKGSIDVGTLTGPGSTITVTAGKSALTQTVTDIGLGSNTGGTFQLTERSASTLQMQGGATNGVNGTINVDGGPNSGGSGGTIVLHNKGIGGITISNASNLSFSPGAGGGAGGKLTLNAGNKGALTISAGTLNANASGSGNYNGGNIDLRGSTITITNGSTVLTANGVGSGNGGNIIAETSTGNITLGGPGNISTISATGGSTDGSTGGNVTVSAGSSLTVGSNIYVGSTAANGKGGNITLAAGSAVAGSSLNIGFDGITGTNLNTSGTGTGSGGNIALVSSGNILLNDIHNAPGIISGGGQINIVAGAAFTTAGNNITVSGSSSTGGFVNTIGFTPITSDGGNLLVVAYGGSGLFSGGVGLLGPINTGSSGSGVNGDVNILAGGSSTLVILNSVNTIGGSSGGGNVSINAAAPILVYGPLSIKHGAITAGSFSAGSLQTASIAIGRITSGAGNVQIAGGGTIYTGIINTTTGNIFAYDASTADNSLVTGYLNTTSGNITLASQTLGYLDITQNLTTNGGSVAILSGGGIRFTSNAQKVTTPGGSITLMSGTSLTWNGATTITVNGDNNSVNATITFSSKGLTLSTANSGINGNGGKVTIATFGGSTGLAPINSEGNPLTINTAGNSFGTNGNVQIVIGASNPTYSSYLGNINTAGGGGGGGNVSIITAEPVINGTLILTNGKFATGSLSPGIDPATDIYTGTITTNSGSVTIIGGANITTGAISTGTYLATSSAFGNSGSVNITSNGGALYLNTINTNGLTAGNFAGNITLAAPIGINMSDINANGYVGSTGGIISISTPGSIVGTFINATAGVGGGNAGSINTSSGTLVLGGTNVYGNSVDASANSGDGGHISLTTTSALTFTVGGDPSGNGVASDITANGVNGGFIALTNYGNFSSGNQIINGNVLANGTNGLGGNILFQGEQPAGSAPLISNIYGLVQANNNANNSGVIGFNGGPREAILLLGTGTLDAGEVVRVGNLNPSTLTFQSPPSGPIYISPLLRISNSLQPAGLRPSQFGIPQPIPNYEDLSKTAVDFTPYHRFPYIDPYNNPGIFQLAARNTNLALIPGTKFFNHNFEGTNLSTLIKDGLVIASNAGSNYLNIDRGNVLFSPSEAIVVGTHEGDVYISPGATVFLMESGHDVVLYDLCQNKPKQVSVVVNNHKLF